MRWAAELLPAEDGVDILVVLVVLWLSDKASFLGRRPSSCLANIVGGFTTTVPLVAAVLLGFDLLNGDGAVAAP